MKLKKVIGLMLLIAVIVAILPSTVGAAPPAAEETYTVQKDDNLWSISEKYLGNGALYRAIVHASNVASFTDAAVARIWDPALIQPGQKLIIPDADTAAASLAPPPAGELGSATKPIQVYFVPSAEIDEIVTGGEVMRQALTAATGLEFEVFVPTSYAAAIEGMCASPGDTMGFPATLAYIVANARCGVDASLISIRYGWDIYWAQYIVARDSDIQSLADLNGKKWGYTDATSTSGHVVPMIELAAAGIELAEKVPTGGYPQAVLAVYNGEVDFATTYYSAALVPEGEPSWKPGMDPEPYADIVDECGVTEDGSKLYCGDYRILDARSASGVRSTAPDVVQKVRILALSDSIPNDCLAFGPDFPLEARVKIELALMEFKETEAWYESIGDFYSWDDVRPASDADYAAVRGMIETAGYSMDDVVAFIEE
jgi:phosphonate transport system substrate-binding protein